MIAVYILLFIIFLLLIYGLYYKSTNEICRSKRRLEGLTCLVTGGTSGLGLEIAKDFSARGARVIIACPSEEEGNAALKMIVQESGNDNIRFEILDLASLKSVRHFAADIIKTEKRLDILMNNAGVGVPRKMTEDGLNIIMQINYLGHFLLTILLLPLLQKSGTTSAPSRIVNTSSVLHRFAWLNVEKLAVYKEYYFSRLMVYANSKLCLLLFSRELKKKLQDVNVIINDADPGEVGTNIFFSAGYILGTSLYLACLYLAKTPFEGAQTGIHAAIDDKAGKVCGKFFRNCKLARPSKKAMDDTLAKKLWDESARLVKLEEQELSFLNK